MDLQLEGKRVLVTGASRGIGLAIVRAFLAEGASVVATARRATPELAATEAVFVPADLATPDGPARLVDAVLARDPRLDVLVNNAGGAERADRVFDDVFNGDDDTWANVFALNLSAAVRTTRAALPALTRARGAVVNISSASARYPHTSPLPYSAAKAALNAFTRGLAEATGKSGVRVNAVTPAATETDLIVGAGGIAADLAALSGVDRVELEKNMPEEFGMLTGKLVDPAEIARAVVLLASPTMPSAIGSNWTVDGGTLKTA